MRKQRYATGKHLAMTQHVETVLIAIFCLQQAHVDRFLLQHSTGAGKTMTIAALVRSFLSFACAVRIDVTTCS